MRPPSAGFRSAPPPLKGRPAHRRASLGAGAALLAAMLAATPARATGSLTCTIADKVVAFEADAVFSHGLGGAFTGFSAHLAVTAKDLPEDLAKLDLDQAALVHHWFHGSELKLHLYSERAAGAHGAVELVLETRQSPKDETLFQGRYVLEVSDLPPGASEAVTRTFKGVARCEAG